MAHPQFHIQILDLEADQEDIGIEAVQEEDPDLEAIEEGDKGQTTEGVEGVIVREEEGFHREVTVGVVGVNKRDPEADLERDDEKLNDEKL